MKPSICRSALFALVLGAGSAAAATPLTAEQTLSQFNLVVFGDAVSSSQHVDGRTWIGGTATGGVYLQDPTRTPTSAYAGLTVGGNATNVMVNNYGAVIGGNLTNATINSGSSVVFGNATSVNFNGPAYVAGSSSANFNGGIDSSLATGPAASAAGSTNFATTLTGLSTQLSHLTGSGSYVAINGNKATFNAVADANGLAVFNLTDSVLAAGEFEFNLGGATTIIINSGAKSADITANFLGGSAQQIGAKTLWNFYNATHLSTYQFGGSVLAPLASFTNYNNIEGGVFVDSLSQRGEIHLQPFTGYLPPVPEPETWAMMLGGLAMLGAIARRRLRG